MKHLRQFIVTPLLLILLVACAPIDPSVLEMDEAAMDATAVPAEEASEEVASASDGCEEGFRLFDHELLASDPLCIPIAPERVVTLDIAALEFMLITDQAPVGAGEWMLQELPLLLPEYADTLAPLEGVGWPADIEQLARFQPDLILAPEGSVDLDLAAEIAPVVVPDPAIWETWQNGMEFWGAVLNQQDLYAYMETAYAQRIVELQSALSEPEAMEISVVSTSTDGIWLWMPDSAPGAVLVDAGLGRPEGQSLVGEEAIARYEEKQWVGISEERIDLVDGDFIFYFTYAAVDAEVAAEEQAYIDTLTEKPLWQSLEAVKEDKAFFVLGHWWRAQTYLLANKVIDDLFIHLTDTTSTTPVLPE
ncbi:MAG: ABC transporter substrate-binding protein [Chloroflexota bacterium]